MVRYWPATVTQPPTPRRHLSPWAASGSRCARKDDLITVVEELIREPNIRFEDAPTVWRSLHDYRLAESVKVGGKRKSTDFADALIVNRSGLVAHRAGEDLDAVYAFDVAAHAIEGTRAP